MGTSRRDQEKHDRELFNEVEVPAALLVPTPKSARSVAIWVIVSFLVLGLFGVLAPWIQSVRGTGDVVAFSPVNRRQSIESPVSGRVVRWFVEEGSMVEEGDPIVQISDNDPEYMLRLAVERETLDFRLGNLELQVEVEREKLTAVTQSQESSVRAARATVEGARQEVLGAEQSVTAAQAAFQTAELNGRRLEELYREGLVSKRELELAELAIAKTRTDLERARAGLQAKKESLSGKESYLEQSKADRLAAIASARTAVQAVEGRVASARAALARFDVTVSRQQAQDVTAPRAGAIFRVVARQGGDQVKAGDELAVLVPHTDHRAVQVWLDGNDASLVTAGRSVRLQFEGWPAVQFSGWPSVAVGTFGGKVAFVDSTDNGKGDFRIVVVPDPDEEPWPEPRYLRQGVRANGWVLLNQVTVGFELWRQLNGFPPTVKPPELEGRRRPGSGPVGRKTK